MEHLPNTSVRILIRIDPDWDRSRDRYEMILFRIVVFSDHLKANFWNSQEPIIVYEVSWLSFEVFIMYIMCLLYLKKNQKYRINIIWAWTRIKKPIILFRIVTEVLGKFLIKIGIGIAIAISILAIGLMLCNVRLSRNIV